MASGPTIVAKFLADTSKMTSDVQSAGGKMQSSVSSFATKAAVAVGGAFAIGAVVDFGKASVDAAAADAEAKDKLARTIKNVTGATDDQVSSNEDFISSLSRGTAIADDDLRPAMDKLVRGFGNVADAQGAMSLATDISAGTGKDLSTVSDALMKGAMGQTTALKKLGVETKNADGSAKSMNDIMADLATTFDGQAKGAAESTAGQMRNAKIQFGEFQETVGTAVLPILGKLASFITVTLLPAFTTVFGWIMDNKDVVIAALVGLGAILLPLFATWAISAGAAAAATIAAAAPFIAIGAVIAGIAYLIIHNWDTIVAATEAAWDAIVGAVKFVFNWIKDNWPLLLAIITGPIGLAVLAIVDNWDTIMGAIQAVWNWIKSTWSTVTDLIAKPVSAAVGIITAAWDGIKGGAQAVWDWLTNTWSSVTSLITAPITAAKDLIVGIWDGVVGTISTAISSIVDAIKAPINAVIRGWNGLEFRIPKIDIPKISTPFGDIGGGSLGGQTFGFPNIPELAGGGVLTSPTLFIGGEAGTEIVAPEEMLRQIMREERGGNYTLNIYPRTADAADIAYGFRRLELMAGIS